MPPAGLSKAVQAIPGKPLPHGILGGCATVEEVKDPHELMGVEWLALGCCPVLVWQDPCLTDESLGDESPGAPQEKEFCRPQKEHAEAFTVIAGSECSALDWSYKEARAHAEAALELGEQAGIEAGFMRFKLTRDGVDLTPPEGPLSIAQGVAVLEGCLAESYGGVGTLHVPMRRGCPPGVLQPREGGPGNREPGDACRELRGHRGRLQRVEQPARVGFLRSRARRGCTSPARSSSAAARST